MKAATIQQIFRAIVLGLVAGLLISSQLFAGAEGIRIDPTKRRGGFLSEATYKRLEAIQAQAAKGETDRALENAGRLLRSTVDPFEKCVVLRTEGNILLSGPDPIRSVASFEQALRIDELTLAETIGMLFNVAQLYASAEDYEETIAFLDLWRPLVNDIRPEAHLLAAASYAGLKRFEEGVAEIRAGIEKSDTPPEQWYQLLLAMLLELKKYPEAIDTLQTMLKHWPAKGEYWRQLASIYSATDQNAEALGVFEIALAGGYIRSESDLLNVVALYMFSDLPAKAAALLETKMEEGALARNLKNMELLGNALMRAQETNCAIAVYRKATAAEESPKLDLLAAQLLLDGERWDEAIEVLRHLTASASYKSSLENPGLAHVLLGNAYYEKGMLDEAKAAFEDGRQFGAVASSCAQWLQTLEAMQAAKHPQQQHDDVGVVSGTE